MSKATTRATINANIKQNGVQAITGPVLNSVLNAMVDDYAEQASTTQELEDLRTELNTEIETFKGEVEADITAFKEEVNEAIDGKADKSGRYPAMSVGSAEALVSRGTATAQEFLTKIASASGASEVKALKGNSLVWNQHIYPFEEANRSKYMASNGVSLSGGTATISGGGYATFRANECAFVSGHKWLVIGKTQSDNASGIFQFGVDHVFYVTNTSTLNVAEIVTITDNDVASNILNHTIVVGTNTGDNASVRCWGAQAINLTQMFGAGNEPSTYAEFLVRCPKVADPFAYNEGVIVSSNPMGIKTTGRNIFPEDCEEGFYDLGNGSKVAASDAIRSKTAFAIEGGKTYYIKSPNEVYYYFFAKDGSYITYEHTRNSEIVAPINASAMAIAVPNLSVPPTYGYDICINVSDPSFNGQYEPYDGHLLPMDLSAIKKDGVSLFPNGLPSAGTAYDEVRKNNAIKRMGVKVFDGSDDEEWSTNYYVFSTYGKYVYGIELADMKEGSLSVMSNRTSGAIAWDGLPSTTLIQVSGNILFFAFTSDTPDTEWRSYLAEHPLEVIYELAEPIVVDVDFNGVFLTTQNGMVEVLDSVPMKADIVEAKDYVDGIEASVEAYKILIGNLLGLTPDKVSAVNLGSLATSYVTSNPSPTFYLKMSGAVGASDWSQAKPKAVCTKYPITGWENAVTGSEKALTIAPGGDPIVINDSSYTDAAAFKKAMNGIFLFYEKA